MSESVCDWSGFYDRLCVAGWQALAGMDDEDRELVAAVAGTSDAFWSDGLQDVLERHAADGDVRAGVLAALEIWLGNVLSALEGDFGLELDGGGVTIDEEHPVITELMAAAQPDAG